MTFLTKTIDI